MNYVINVSDKHPLIRSHFQTVLGGQSDKMTKYTVLQFTFTIQ